MKHPTTEAFDVFNAAIFVVERKSSPMDEGDIFSGKKNIVKEQ